MEEQGRTRVLAVAVASLGLILIVGAVVGVGLASAEEAGSGPVGMEGEVEEVELVTDEAVGFAGELEARVPASEGAGLVARWGDPGVVELAAERLHVRTEVAKGERVSLPSGDEVWRDGSHERRTWTFEEVEVQIEAWQPTGLLLAEPSEDARARVEAGGSQTTGVIEDHTLAWLGSRDGSSEGEGRLPAYEHRLEEPTVLLEGRGRGEVEGAFTLFTDGATVSVERGEGGEEVWRNWTGIRWEQTAPDVEEYELRITLLEVEGGRLSVGTGDGQEPTSGDGGEDEADRSAAAGDGSPDGVDVGLLGGGMLVESQGRIEAKRADGLVELGDGEAYLLEETAVVLAGEARGLARPSPLSSVGGGARSPEEPSPSLSFALEGDLSVLAGEGERLTRLSTSDEGGVGLLSVLVPFAFVALAAIAAVLQPAILRPLPDRWKDRLYRRWKNEGLARESEGEFVTAAGFYRRLVRLRPERPMGWFLLARARVDGGEPYEAIEVLRRGRDRAGVVPLDLLELQAEAWGMLGVEAAARATLEAIAEEDGGYAVAIGQRLAEEGDIPVRAVDRLRKLAAEQRDGRDEREEGRHLAGYT